MDPRQKSTDVPRDRPLRVAKSAQMLIPSPYSLSQRERVKTKCGAETISINRGFLPGVANITALSCGSLAGMRELRFST